MRRGSDTQSSGIAHPHVETRSAMSTIYLTFGRCQKPRFARALKPCGTSPVVTSIVPLPAVAAMGRPANRRQSVS